jgi:hypothetical protein
MVMMATGSLQFMFIRTRGSVHDFLRDPFGRPTTLRVRSTSPVLPDAIPPPGDSGAMPTPHDRWTAILRDFDCSGLTAAWFCARRRLLRSAFHRWRKRLGRRSAPTFHEALLPAAASAVVSTLTGELRCVRRISVPDGFGDLARARVSLERIDRLDAFPCVA